MHWQLQHRRGRRCSGGPNSKQNSGNHGAHRSDLVTVAHSSYTRRKSRPLERCSRIGVRNRPAMAPVPSHLRECGTTRDAPPMSITVIKNARLVNEGSIAEGDLRIRDGRIAKIGAALDSRAGARDIDARGASCCPGMIDDQVHFREPGLEHKGDIATESTRRGRRRPHQLHGDAEHAIRRRSTRSGAARQTRARGARARSRTTRFYLGATNDNLEAIKAVDRALTCGIKVFMGASTGNMLVDNPATLDGIFRERADADHHALRGHADDRWPNDAAAQGALRRRHSDAREHPNIRSARGVHEVDAARAGARPAPRHAPARAAPQHRARARAVRTSRFQRAASASPPRPASTTCSSTTRRTQRLGNHIKCNPAIKDARPTARR